MLRLRLTTRDGCLVGNRQVSEWSEQMYKNDSSFFDHSIEIECREKGVRYISHTIGDEHIDVLVEWC